MTFQKGNETEKWPSGHQGPVPNLAQLEGSSKKRNQTLRLCCQAVPGLLAAGVQTAPTSWQPLRSEKEVSSWTLTGTINSRSPTSQNAKVWKHWLSKEQDQYLIHQVYRLGRSLLGRPVSEVLSFPLLSFPLSFPSSEALQSVDFLLKCEGFQSLWESRFWQKTFGIVTLSESNSTQVSTAKAVGMKV